MQRRSFLKWVTCSLGTLLGAILGVPALAFLIDPRNRAAPSGDFKTVARLGELQVDVPRQVLITDVRRDAWIVDPNDVVGSIWLIRRADNKVEAFSAICPHLGCFIGLDEKDKQFVCPCHGARFNLEGTQLPGPENKLVSPRHMDSLRVQVESPPGNTDPNDQEVRVKYEKFVPGKDTPIGAT